MRRPQTKKESHVKAAVKKLLDNHGWFWFMPPANQYGRSGISDFLAIKSGMFMAIETKFGINDPTPSQLGFLDTVRSHDHFAFVVRETSLDALASFLENLDKSIAYAAQGQVAPAEVGGPLLNAIKRMEELAIHRKGAAGPKRGHTNGLQQVNGAASSVLDDGDHGHDDHDD